MSSCGACKVLKPSSLPVEVRRRKSFEKFQRVGGVNWVETA